MRRTASILVLALGVAGCASPGNLPGHNHPEGVTVGEPGDGAPDAAALTLWSITVAGAT